MGKIYCYSLDFHTKEEEFESLDVLLENIAGAKEQAVNALNNKDASYRGYRLVSEEALGSFLPTLISNRSEKIRSDYVDSITELETKIKKLEKAERKSLVKLDVLKDDHQVEISNINKQAKEDEENLTKDYEGKLQKLDVENKNNLQKIEKENKNTLLKLLSEHDNEKEQINKQIEKYSNDVQNEVNRYMEKLSAEQTEYNKQLAILFAKKEENIKRVIENKELFIKKLKEDIFTLTNQFNSLKNLMDTIIKNESPVTEKEHPVITFKGLSKDKLNFEKTNYLPVDSQQLKAKPKPFKTENLTLESKYEKNEVVGKVELPKEEVKKVEETIVAPEVKELEKVEVSYKPRYLNNVEVKSNEDYLGLSLKEKALYLYQIREVTLEELVKLYPTVIENLKGIQLCREILHVVNDDKKNFSEVAHYLNLEVAKSEFQTISTTRVQYNKFFNLSEDLPTISVESVPISKEDSDNVEKIISDSKKTNILKGTGFDWVTFKEKYVRTEELKLIFSRETISLNEASTLVEASAIQIRNMLGVLKNLGYTRQYKNESLLTTDEILILLVSMGYFKSSRNAKSKSSESLQSIITKLYPSWKSYIENK